MLVRVASYVTAIEAHLARGRLEAEGIPAFVIHEHHVGIIWFEAMALTLVKVYVHGNDIDFASKVIAMHDRGEYALPEEEEEACPKCNESTSRRGRISWKSALLVLHLTHIPLWFRWATRKCLACRHEWDLPNTRAYPLITIGIAGILAVIVALSLLLAIIGVYCLDGHKYWLIFQQRGSCGY